jgi:hypothetical protein
VKLDKGNNLIIIASCGLDDVLNLELKPTPYFKETKELKVVVSSMLLAKNYWQLTLMLEEDLG